MKADDLPDEYTEEECRQKEKEWKDNSTSDCCSVKICPGYAAYIKSFAKYLESIYK